jgi:hypothetical protein
VLERARRVVNGFSVKARVSAIITSSFPRDHEDGNPNTRQGANCSTPHNTPPFPAYAGNMAGIGTSQATILALFFGRDDIHYQVT